MITTFFESPTVILWCFTIEARIRNLATAMNYDDMVPYSLSGLEVCKMNDRRSTKPT